MNDCVWTHLTDAVYIGILVVVFVVVVVIVIVWYSSCCIYKLGSFTIKRDFHVSFRHIWQKVQYLVSFFPISSFSLNLSLPLLIRFCNVCPFINNIHGKTVENKLIQSLIYAYLCILYVYIYIGTYIFMYVRNHI